MGEIKITYKVWCFKCEDKTEHTMSIMNIHGINICCAVCFDTKKFKLVGYKQSSNQIWMIPEKELDNIHDQIRKIVKEDNLEKIVTESVYGGEEKGK